MRMKKRKKCLRSEQIQVLDVDDGKAVTITEQRVWKFVTDLRTVIRNQHQGGSVD